MIANIQEIKLRHDEGVPLKELAAQQGLNYDELCTEWKSRGWAVFKRTISLESLDEDVPTNFELERLVRAKMMRLEEKQRRVMEMNARIMSNQFLQGIDRKCSSGKLHSNGHQLRSPR